MQRWKITVEYDGGPYVGWQKQDNKAAVQSALEKAVFKFSGETVKVQGSGRTDSGVHALAQVAHFDLEMDIAPLKVREAFNFHLKREPIAVIEVEATHPEFHARFDAKERAYLYRILDRRAKPSLDLGRVWHVHNRVDVEAMHEAAQVLVGLHDFSSFRAKDCQSQSPTKTLDRLDVVRVGDEVHITAVARSFLHHQIRNFAGTLHLVGRGKWNKANVQAALDAKDRQKGGPTAPAEGLYLTRIEY